MAQRTAIGVSETTLEAFNAARGEWSQSQDAMVSAFLRMWNRSSHEDQAAAIRGASPVQTERIAPGGDIQRLISQLMREGINVDDEVHTALTDGRITQAELDELMKHLRRLESLAQDVGGAAREMRA